MAGVRMENNGQNILTGKRARRGRSEKDIHQTKHTFSLLRGTCTQLKVKLSLFETHGETVGTVFGELCEEVRRKDVNHFPIHAFP